jgi:hypothetical protein
VFDFEWFAAERAFNVRTPTGWVLLAFEHSGGSAKDRKPEKTKAAKATKAAKTAPPPDEPDSLA